jgi:hypothetical protein
MRPKEQQELTYARWNAGQVRRGAVQRAVAAAVCCKYKCSSRTGRFTLQDMLCMHS